MERYQGVKFGHRRTADFFDGDHSQLTTLNRWAYLFSELGLAPVHGDGAYGNQSYRTGPSSFVITRSGMIPAQELDLDNFCQVVGFEEATRTFDYRGKAIPSSESLLHKALYQSQPQINAILHGHSALFNRYAERLNIPVTASFEPYGTPELAESALALMDGVTRFFLLKDHGFVALGENIEQAGQLTLASFATLIKFLQNRS
jgi:ribulose-5-phosphate 4-epimerase/fuculose-1-phosphate aldolase